MSEVSVEERAGPRQPPRWRTGVFWALFLVILFLPRLIRLDEFYVQDESLWLTRSLLYVQGIGRRDWDFLASVPPFHFHPGATLMALVGPALSAYADVNELAEEGFDTWPPEDQRAAATVGRAVVGSAVSALLAILFLLIRRLPPFRSHPWWAATSVAFLGFEPWLWGISRTVHLDALLSLFLLLSLAAAVRARDETSLRWALFSGSAFGLAFMTKSPAAALLIVAMTPLLLRTLRAWRTTIRLLSAWSAAAVLTAVAAWPPMWFHPFLRLRDILGLSTTRVAAPETYLWPGLHLPLFAVLLSTTTAVGVILYVLLRGSSLVRRQGTRALLFPDIALVGGLLFGGVLLAVGGDHIRKNLPALAFLALPAAVGWLTLAERLRALSVVAAGGLLALHATLVLPWFPHLTTYHNAFLRSTEGKRLLVDIGNGSRLVADHFNAREPVTFATNLPGLVQPYLTPDRRGNVRRLPKSGLLGELPPEVEMLVIPESFPARVTFDAGARALLSQLAGKTPEAVLHVRDVPLFSLYRVPPRPVPAER